MSERLPEFTTRDEELLSPEVLSSDELKWFAGALEIGGSAGISVFLHKRGGLTTKPFIKIHEKDEVLADTLKARYRGMKVPAGGSWIWGIAGNKAAEIVAGILPYTVSRNELSLALSNWLHSSTKDEKLKIAEDVKSIEVPTNQEMTQEEYSLRLEQYINLVHHPAFVAGILDHRSSIGLAKEADHLSRLYIVINSENKALLEALSKVYGGDFGITVHKGEVKKIRGREIIAESDVYRLTIATAQARLLANSVQQHLKVPPPDGWDKLYSEDLHTKRNEEVEQLAKLIQEELDLFKSGKIDRLKNREELAQLLNLTPPTLASRLRQLPEELRTIRTSIVRSFNDNRILSRSDIEALKQLINEEVQDFLAGKRDTLTTNQQWAGYMNVKVHVIINNVVRALDSDIFKVRTSILRSIIAKRRNEKYGNPNSRVSQ